MFATRTHIGQHLAGPTAANGYHAIGEIFLISRCLSIVLRINQLVQFVPPTLETESEISSPQIAKQGELHAFRLFVIHARDIDRFVLESKPSDSARLSSIDDANLQIYIDSEDDDKLDYTTTDGTRVASVDDTVHKLGEAAPAAVNVESDEDQPNTW